MREAQIASQLGGIANHPQSSNRLFGIAHVGATARAFLLHLTQLSRHIGSGEPQRLQPGEIQRNANLAVDTADAGDRSDAGHRQKRARQLIVDEPAERLGIHSAGTDRIRQHRLAGDIELLDDGFAQSRGQIGPNALHRRSNIVQGFLYRLLEPELDGEREGAILNSRGDVPKALHRSDCILHASRHVVFK